MQQSQQVPGWGGAERKRVEGVVETLDTLHRGGESLAAVAHDARNMVTALGLYCDLLEQPGVLAPPFAHYGNELQLVAAASRRLVEKLVALNTEKNPEFARLRTGLADPARRPVRPVSEDRFLQERRWDLMPPMPIENLAAELLANRSLLAALAGPSIALTADAEGGALPVRLSGEDFTRILVNLVKNAAEAMPAGGRIQLSLRELQAGPEAPRTLTLSIADSGPGIPARMLDRVFEAGFSTKTASAACNGWPAAHRGLGLSITRSIIESAGGRISARNPRQARACLEIELPVGWH